MKFARAALILLAAVAPASAGVVSDAAMGYTITLPANWEQIKTRSDHHHFKDATGQYRSRLSIVKYSIDQADYPNPRDWTQAQFIAYKLAVETSAYPFGSVTYFDTSASVKISGQWAPEAYSLLFPGDGSPTYCEYLRFCARGNVGYEIYAIGDSADMASRIDYYAGILQTLDLTTPTATLARRPASRTGPRISAADALGRILPSGPSRRIRALAVPLRADPSWP